ncbi:MAG: hypothetical protein KDH88_10650 [Chromatiales bacterium]|nr:hypothetical protein [Chromatiales bacterium]
METDHEQTGITLTGIDGANPLGFLAAIGCSVIANGVYPDLKIAWTNQAGVWRPQLLGCDFDREKFLENFYKAFVDSPADPYRIDARLPFEAKRFSTALLDWGKRSHVDDRRTIDLLGGFGTELYPDDKGVFQDTQFRMVRSADADGQGLPAYALKSRLATDKEKMRVALFGPWSYQDVFFKQHDEKTGKMNKRPVPSFRWDPMDDRRYALRWGNPTKKSENDLGTVVAANALAVEALGMLPVFTVGRSSRTTGFHRASNRKHYFTWPVWSCPVGLDTVRSLLALKELAPDGGNTAKLRAMGVVEVYRCQRIAQNQYYNNFTSAESVA